MQGRKMTDEICVDEELRGRKYARTKKYTNEKMHGRKNIERKNEQTKKYTNEKNTDEK